MDTSEEENTLARSKLHRFNWKKLFEPKTISKINARISFSRIIYSWRYSFGAASS